MKIKVIGDKELIVELDKRAKLNELPGVMKKNGAEMHQSAQRYAPVDTGTLKRAITLDVTDRQAKVASTVDYNAYQEYGTRYQPGTPHIRPAFNDQKDKFLDDLKKIVKG